MAQSHADVNDDADADLLAGRAPDRVMLRFAIGVTLAVCISQMIGWPAGFISAVFLAMLLKAPRPLSFEHGFIFLAVTAVALAVGMLLGAFVPYMPIITVLILVLLFCAIFYWAQAGISQLLVVLSIVGLTVMPVVAAQSLEAARDVGGGILTSGFVAVLLSWLMFGLLPPDDMPKGDEPPSSAPSVPPKSSGERFVSALVMTAIITPLVIAFLFFGWTQLIVLIIPAILVQQLSLSAGIKGGLALVAVNMAGGLVAVAIYYFLVAAPYFIMLAASMLLVSLLFARQIFSGQPAAALWSSAYTAIVIIVCGAVSPFGDDAEAKLFDRIGQLMLGVAYVGAAFALWHGLRFGGISTGAPGSTSDRPSSEASIDGYGFDIFQIQSGPEPL